MKVDRRVAMGGGARSRLPIGGARWVFALSCCGLACQSDPTQTPEGSESSGATEATTSESMGTADGTSSGGSTDSADATTAVPVDMGVDPNDQIPPPDEEGCPAIYAQDLLPTFELTIAPETWELLMEEWNNGPANEAAGLEYAPYHALDEFRYGDVVIDDAQIRLRGDPTLWNPLPDDKMQFQIDFSREDPSGRFWGLERLVFDAATFNRHMLRNRLALRFMRDVGVVAPCANNARLAINGEYYGIFTNLEKLDAVFLERTMADPTGDLWQRANWYHEAGPGDMVRLMLLQDPATLAELDAILDVEQALLTYAAEAVVPDADGGWGGGQNDYFYDDPERGKFMLLPWDLGNTFERFDDDPGGPYPIDPDPVVWERPTTQGRLWYDLALQDPAYFDLYIDTIDQILHEGYEPAKMLGWIDEMSAQIEEAVLTDMNKPYSNDLYHTRLDDLREYVQGRYDFVDQWLVCWQSGGTADPEGYCVPP
jgi:hypothetical protein